MRRLRALALALALGAGALSLGGCHENLTVFQVCDAFKAGDHWGVYGYKWAFGVYFCRAGTSAGGFDEYCVFPGPDPHWFHRQECDWESQLADPHTFTV